MDSIVTPVFPIIIILGIIGFAIIIATFFKRDKETNDVEKRTFVYAYHYVILFLSLVFILIGTTLVFKSGLSYPFGIDFGFRGEPQYEEMREPVQPNGLYKEPKIIGIHYEDHIQGKTLLQGIIILFFSVLFFVVHLKSIKKINRDGEHVFLKKSYLLITTLVFGGVFIIIVPLSLYHSLSAYLFAPESTDDFYKYYYQYRQYIPAESIGIALSSGIVWICHLREFLGFKKKTKKNKK